MLVVGFMLFTVRWNPVNGKLPGLALLGCAANIGMTTFNGIDGGVFIPRLLYVHAAVIAVAGIHVIIHPNPAIKAAVETNKSK
jgi:hypothetical protein